MEESAFVGGRRRVPKIFKCPYLIINSRAKSLLSGGTIKEDLNWTEKLSSHTKLDINKSYGLNRL